MQLRFLAVVSTATLLVLHVQASRRSDAWIKLVRARNLAAAGLPDPTCSSGRLSVAGVGPSVCCAGYCGECSDYPTCSKVRGQDSQNACCQEKVYGMRCGGGAPANTCLKKCSVSVPPCIMDEEVEVRRAEKRGAGDDCNEAVKEWRANVERTLESSSKQTSKLEENRTQISKLEEKLESSSKQVSKLEKIDGKILPCETISDCEDGFYCHGKGGKRRCKNTCDITADCPRRYKCQGNAGGPKTCKRAPQFCDADDDCKKNHGCIKGFCQVKPRDSCTQNDDCPSAFFCAKDLCVKKVSTCTINDDCPQGYNCQGGGVGSKGVKQCRKHQQYCEKDYHCGRNKVCQDNLCALRED